MADKVACRWVVAVEPQHLELPARSCRWHCLPCVRRPILCTRACFRLLRPCCHRASPRWERRPHLVRHNRSSWWRPRLRSWFRRIASPSRVARWCPSCGRQRSFVWHRECRRGERVRGFVDSWKYRLRQPARHNQPTRRRRKIACTVSHRWRNYKRTYLWCTPNHVLDEITMTWSIDNGYLVLVGFEFPQGNIDGNTTFTFGFQFIQQPGVFEWTLAHLHR